MKHCFKCGAEKPLTEFYRHPRMPDGYLNKCKDCARRDSLENYTRKCQGPEWMESERARNRERMRRKYNCTTVWVAPEGSAEAKRQAANAVANAVRAGRLVKPDQCEECGREGARVEGHHDDYEKPLKVRWLCRKCHLKFHLVPRAA